ncbi:hypothetical protein B0H16DRAFT_1035031 [Mycena metata]|uniref:DUF6534 domain-containing protein n=1 Tax=Mycena metata TaxID=1033252 RepID=A0AAD7IFB0_9AGAR|nr:hypothetical protein B0H16DRAFT_1035031 [Mycena metata]
MAPFNIEPLLVSFGVQLASSWVNMMLYMLEIVMCFRYFQRSARPLPHKIGVGAMVFFDTLCTMSVDANILITFLSFFGKESFVAISVPTSTTIFLTYLTAIVEQLFLCQLYFILSRKRVVTLVLIGLGAIHLSFSFAGGILLQTETSPFSGRLTFTITAVGAIMCAVNDFLIAGCLGYEMYKMKKSNSATPSVLRRLTILSITSGAIVASTTLLMMILLLKGSIAFSFFFSCQGRVYALTLLVNFLSSPSDSSSTSASSSKNAMVDHFGGYVDGGKKSAPSIHSNYSDASMKKLPPLPPSTPQSQTINLSSAQMMALDFAARAQFASPTSQFASVPHSPSSSSRVVWSPRMPQTPRTIIPAPHRKSSLPV